MCAMIAYDLGTGGIKSSLFDEAGRSLADVFIPYKTYYPASAWSEQAPMDWWQAVCRSTRLLLKKSGYPKSGLTGAALSGHSLVAVPIDRAGQPLLDRVPIWSDMRAADCAETFFQTIPYGDWYLATGNGDPPACYTVFKLMWLKKHLPEVYKEMVKFVGSKDFINYLLTGAVCTDPSYASGFGVFDLATWQYRPDFMEAAGVDPEIFPPVVPTASIVGRVTAEAARQTGLPEGLPVACGAVDNTCMALGATGIGENQLYTSLGSSSWIALTSRKPVLDLETRPFVFAHAQEGYYTSAVSIFSAGNSFRWVRDTLCINLQKEADSFEAMNVLAAQVPAGSNGLLFCPALSGGSAQEPSPNLRGSYLGLSLGTTQADLIRASMEGVAIALRCVFEVLRTHIDSSAAPHMLLCGGGSKSPLWCQIFADVYNMQVVKTNIDQNAASLGAAAIAARACGIWENYEKIPSLHTHPVYYSPNPESNRVYEDLLPIYRQWVSSMAALLERSPGLH